MVGKGGGAAVLTMKVHYTKLVDLMKSGIESARPQLARSLTVATQTGGEEVNDDRTSNGMFFRRSETEAIARIEPAGEAFDGPELLRLRGEAQHLRFSDAA